MKRILDSVHGYIYLDDALVRSFVDTPCFQRLRRIEQTSVRAVFPSARHDRFIHSLGVYAIGKRIVDSIKSKGDDFVYNETIHAPFFNSYLVACLMHDCAHTPFSHTFEEYFKHDTDELPSLLKGEMEEPDVFETDRFDANGEEIPIAPHEYLSAILSLKKYKEPIKNYQAIPDLVARMIVGIQYKNGHSFENCLISLIHGDIIDADRLDYACRDRWASGYSTSTIDVDRLISSLHIKKTGDAMYSVCYDSAALHDIQGVLAVKEFQQKYVVNHHTVCYEQFLLKKAMEHSVYRLLHNGNDSNDEEEVTSSLKTFCQPNILWNGIHEYGLNIDFLSDDDFVVLMKKYLADNQYAKQWFGRQYSMKPLWKSKADYYSLFPNKRTEQLNEYNSVYRLCDPYNLRSNFAENLESDDILRLDAKEKVTHISNHLQILTKQGDIKSYEDLFGTQEPDTKTLFFYLYLSQKAMIYKDEIINILNTVEF